MFARIYSAENWLSGWHHQVVFSLLALSITLLSARVRTLHCLSYFSSTLEEKKSAHTYFARNKKRAPPPAPLLYLRPVSFRIFFSPSQMTMCPPNIYNTTTVLGPHTISDSALGLISLPIMRNQPSAGHFLMHEQIQLRKLSQMKR